MSHTQQYAIIQDLTFKLNRRQDTNYMLSCKDCSLSAKQCIAFDPSSDIDVYIYSSKKNIKWSGSAVCGFFNYHNLIYVGSEKKDKLKSLISGNVIEINLGEKYFYNIERQKFEVRSCQTE